MGLGFEPKQGLKDPIYQVTAHVAEGSRELLSVGVKEKHGSDICGRYQFCRNRIPWCNFGLQIKLPMIHEPNDC